MKRTAIFIALLSAFGAAQGGTVDNLWPHYNRLINGDASNTGLTTHMHNSRIYNGACDLTSCGAGTSLSSLPTAQAPTANSDGRATAAAIFKALAGRAFSYEGATIYFAADGSHASYHGQILTPTGSLSGSVFCGNPFINGGTCSVGVSALGLTMSKQRTGCSGTSVTTYTAHLSSDKAFAGNMAMTSSITTTGDNAGCYATCFPAGTMVLMAGGETKRIEEIGPGEKVVGMGGSVNTVKGLWRPKLNDRTLFRINDTFETTADHMMLVKAGGKAAWGAIDPALYKERRFGREAEVITAAGTKTIFNGAIAPESVMVIQEGSTLLDYQGTEKAVTSIRVVDGTTPELQLYTLHTDGTESFVVDGGYVVDGMPQKPLDEH